MGKGKKGGKRISKKQLAEKLEGFFTAQPEETFSHKEIFHTFRLNTHPPKVLAIDLMGEMARDDFLTKVSDHSYRLNQMGQAVGGLFRRKGNGKNSFTPDGSDKPIFVSERNSTSALSGDRVRVSLMARRQKHIKEVQVIEILQCSRDQFVGKLRVEKNIAFLVTQENLFANDILIPKNKLKGGQTSDKVVVKVSKWPDENHKNIIGEAVDVLGKAGDNDAEMHTILAQCGLPHKYPKAIEDAVEQISGEITKQGLTEREDFRQVFTCTIGPKDAKDFDDALSIREVSKGIWEVSIRIAGVTHYVTEKSITDKEAQKRATSVYLVDRTIPMSPERLCNLTCSLRPDEGKLCYSVIVEMDVDGFIRSQRIVHAVVKSNRRYVYKEVQQLLESNGVVDRTGQPIPALHKGGYKREHAKELIMLDTLVKKLREERFKNGAVKFDSEEPHFDVDGKGKPIRCYLKRSKDTNKLIEEFMLLADRTMAESAGKVKRSAKAKILPYRVHDNPNPQRLENLKDLIVKFGYKMKTAGTKGQTARSLNRLIEAVDDTDEQKLIQAAALRAMMKAKYTICNIGHFGLAFDYYTHFTSPIRRYPDMTVHRLLTRYAKGGRSANKDYYERLCEHSSDMEQVIASAERDSIKYRTVEFMGEHIGEEFDAHISGIQSYGTYCEIDENHCEGMVPMHDLDDDYYDLDEKNYCLVGRRHHYKHQLGDPTGIKVTQVNLEKRQFGFTLVD